MPVAHHTSAQPPRGGRYTLELSRGPRFPEVPSSPGFPSCPCAITGATCVAGSSFRAHLISLRVRQTLRPSGTPRRRDLTRFHARPGHTGIASRAPFHGRPTSSGDRRSGLGRTGELHPRAPFVAQRARLKALRFSVCSVRDWRSRTCRIGFSGVTFRSVCFAVGGLPVAHS